MYIIHMGVALAELCLLGNKTQHSQVGYKATDRAVNFDSKLRKLKLEIYPSISPGKVEMQKIGDIGCRGKVHSLHLLRMLPK